MRAVAVASRDEAEFVRRARGSGLLVRPRFAAGAESVVVGYSAAAQPAAGERPVSFGGGRLDRDLTLPRLREAWPDTPEHAARHHRPANPGRETRAVDPRLVEAARRDVAELRDRLAVVPVTDTVAWSAAAHDAAGMVAALSARIETPGPGPLARSAQHRSTSRPGTKRATGRGRVTGAVLIRQLTLTAKAIHDAARAAGDLRQARALARTVRADLAAHPGSGSLPGGKASGPAGGFAVLERPLAPPVPGGLDPEAAPAARALDIRTDGVAAPTGSAATPPSQAASGQQRSRKPEGDLGR